MQSSNTETAGRDSNSWKGLKVFKNTPTLLKNSAFVSLKNRELVFYLPVLILSKVISSCFVFFKRLYLHGQVFHEVISSRPGF